MCVCVCVCVCLCVSVRVCYNNDWHTHAAQSGGGDLSVAYSSLTLSWCIMPVSLV